MVCLLCNNDFIFVIGRSEKFCSRKCFYEYKKNHPENHWHWKGGRAKHSEGYTMILIKNHPNADSHGYVPEHRLIVEKELNRYLTNKEEIHHINGIKTDNRIVNLMIVTKKEHARIEHGWRLINGSWFKHCPNCKKYLEVNEGNFYRRSSGQFISVCKKCC